METATQTAPQETGLLGWIFKQRGILANLPLLFALVWVRGETQNAALAWSIGFVLVFLGFTVRVWAQPHIQHRWRNPMVLTASGPYQMMRNPLYIGNTLIIVGAVVFSRLLWLAPVALIWCGLVYSVVVRVEERDLLYWNGESYRQFQAAVPRWIPRAWKQPHFITEKTGRAIVSELHCFLVLLPFVLKEVFLSLSLGRTFLNNIHL